MSQGKLVTVYGATGAQGGSVVASLLQNKAHEFSLRAITRYPSSERATRLASQGVEVVQANVFYKDQMMEAFKGSWAAFVNTNSTDPAFQGDGGLTEVDLGKSIVDAVFEAGVQHFVYSGIASAIKASNGAAPYRCADDKYAIGEYAKTKGFESVMILSAGWYMENMFARELAAGLGGFPFDVDDEGYLTFRSPRWYGDDKFPFIAMQDDWGDLVHGVLLNVKRWNGCFIHGVSDLATPEHMVSEFQSITGNKSRYVPIDAESVQTGGDADMEIVKSMFIHLRVTNGKYYGEPVDMGPARELKAIATAARGKPQEEGMLMTLDRWLRKHYST